MPSVVTHYTFAKRFVHDIDERYLNAVYVGAQGPDHWFAFGNVSKKNREHAEIVRALGNVTQIDELTPNYVGFIEYAKQSEDKELLFAYIEGLMMHYSLDRACHPYIFYKTGFTDRPEDSEEIHKYYNHGHLLMEVFLDLIIGKKYGTYGPGAKMIALNSKDLMKISKMWCEVNKTHQKVEYIEEDSFYKSVHDYQKALRMTYSPLGIKKWGLGLVFGKDSAAYGLSAPRNLNKFKDVDFLNENHTEWYMPDNTGPQRESFLDLFNNEAKEIYEKLHNVLQKAKNNEEYADDLLNIGNHINHEGIIPHSPKVTWKLIWPESFIKDIIEPKYKH